MPKLLLFFRFIITLVFLILLFIYTPDIQFDNSLKRWVPEESGEVQAYQEFLDKFGGDAFLIVSFCHTPDSIQAEIKPLLEVFQAKVRTFDTVKEILEWPIWFFDLKKSAPENITSYVVSFVPRSHLNPNRPELLQKIKTLVTEIPLESHIAGTGVIYEAINAQTRNTTIRYLAIGLLLLFGLLLAILTRPTAFLLSLAISLGGVGSLLLCSAIFKIPLSMVSVILPVLILFYGTSSSLHILFHGGDFRKVLIPCLLATCTTCIGFLVFLFDPIPLLRDFAILAIAGIIGSLVWAFIFFFPKTYTFQPREFWIAIFRKVPIPSKLSLLTVILILMLAMIPGILKLKSEIHSISILPPDNQAALDHHFIEQNVGNYFPLEYVIEIDRVKSAEVENWIAAVFELEEIDGVLSYLSFSMFYDPQDYGYQAEKDKNLGRVTFLVPLLSTTRGMTLVKKIRALAETNFNNYNPGITGYVTLYAVVADKLEKSFQQSLIWAFLLVFLLIFLFLRNFKLFLAALLPNIFPILFIIGLMGWLKIPLDMVTVPIGCLLLSIIVDDTIHFLYWFKNTGDLRTTFQEAGPGLFHTTLVLFIGFSVFLFSSVPPIKHFGILSVTALVSALVGDLVLLPIILKRISKMKVSDEKTV